MPSWDWFYGNRTLYTSRMNQHSQESPRPLRKSCAPPIGSCWRGGRKLARNACPDGAPQLFANTSYEDTKVVVKGLREMVWLEGFSPFVYCLRLILLAASLEVGIFRLTSTIPRKSERSALPARHQTRRYISRRLVNNLSIFKFTKWLFIRCPGGTHKHQSSKPPTPYPPVSTSANNHNRQRLGKVLLGNVR